MRNNFYCKIKTGGDFSIDEWNKAFRYCNDNNIEEPERSEILEGVPCDKQCFDCMATVGETRLKNKHLTQPNKP